MTDSLSELSRVIAQGLIDEGNQARSFLEALFDERYHKNSSKDAQIRDAFKLSVGRETDVPYAGIIPPDNPTSGPYGGASLVWFPTKVSLPPLYGARRRSPLASDICWLPTATFCFEIKTR